MNLQLLCVGKLKEKYLRQGCDEYIKRIQPYAKLSIVEVPEEKTQEPISSNEKYNILQKESQRMKKHIHPNTYLIALAIEGKSFSSEKLAQKIDRLTTYGQNHLTFVIGSSYGLSTEILHLAHLQLSFSPMTFPHQLMRLILLEQIYRICKINRRETYHK